MGPGRGVTANGVWDEPPPPANRRTAQEKWKLAPVPDPLQCISLFRQSRRVRVELRLGLAGHHVIGKKWLIEVYLHRFDHRGRSERCHGDAISAARARHDFPVADQGFARMQHDLFRSSTPCRPCGRRHAWPASGNLHQVGPLKIKSLEFPRHDWIVLHGPPQFFDARHSSGNH